MQTISQLIPQLFEDSSEDINVIHERLARLQTVSESSSNFLNTMASSKYVASELSASKMAANVFDGISNISDIEFEKTEYGGGHGRYELHDIHGTNTDVLTCKSLVEFMHDKFGVIQDGERPVIGYYQGIPIYLETRVDGIHKSFKLYSLDANDINCQFFMRLDYSKKISSGEEIVILELLQPEDMNDDSTFYLLYYDDLGGFTWSLVCMDNIVSDTFNSYVSYDCLLNVIKRAQADGTVSRDQIESVIKQYGTTDVTAALATMIAGMGTLDSTSVLAVVGKVLSLSDASYTSGNQFQVYQRQNFVTSIVQAVVSLVIAAVTVILTAIFRALGAIISIVSSLISSFIDMFRNNIAKTESKIVRSSLVPVWNNPLTTFDLTKAEVDAQQNNSNSRLYNTTWADIQEVLNDSGCAMISMANGAEPGAWFLWILPKDDNTITCQILINTTILSQNSVTIGNGVICTDHGVTSQGGVPYADITVTTGFIGDTYAYESQPDSEYKYLSYNEEHLQRAAATNACICLADLLLRGRMQTLSLPGFNVGGWLSNDEQHVNFSKVTIGSIIQRLSYMSVSGEYKLTALATLGSLPICAMVDLNYDTITPGWERLSDLYTICQDNSSIIKGWFLQNPIQSSTAQMPWALLNSGIELSKPAAEWPNLSRSALMNALLLSALTAVAITGVAIGAKMGLKKVAFKKLSTRQYEYGKSEEKWKQMKKDLDDPEHASKEWTKDEIKEVENSYYKSNKRLTRAWNLAGKLGLTMFNGFSTGSESVSIPTGETSPLTSIASGMSGQSASLNSMSGSATSTYDLNYISRLITGI